MVLYLLIVLGLLVRLYVIYPIGLFQEDALITLRYAKNLWNGIGFVYNQSEYILGATSPLWTVITSPFVGLLPYSIASKMIGILGLVFWGVVQIIAFRLTAIWKLSFSTRFFLQSILSLHPTLVAFSVSGMETSLFVLLILGSLHESQYQRFSTSFVFAGFSVLTRPEGVIWCACLWLYFILRQRKFPWRESIAMILVVFPWIGFAWLYFGSPIPQSAIAKSNWISNQITLLDFLWRPSSLYTKWVGFNGILFPSLPLLVQGILALGWLVLLIAGLVIAYKRQFYPIMLLAGFFLAYVSFYYFGNARVFEWYWMPGIVSVVFVVALALGTVTDAILERLSKSDFFGLVLFSRAVFLGGTFLLLLALFIYKVDGFWISQNEEEVVRHPLGVYLEKCSDPQATVMLEPLGYIGYFSERHIIDLAGLVTPIFASVRQKATPGWMLEQIRVMKPSYIVLRAYEVPTNSFFASFDAPLFSNGMDKNWFDSNYIQEKVFGTGKYGMVIYRRTDLLSLCSLTN
jgi:hypothetical protein